MSLAQYSAFNHLVSALFLSPESLMLIVAPDPFTLYCDKSDVGKGQLTAVGGAIASVKNWKELDAEWSEVLASEGLAYFHMREFAHSREQFSQGWGDDENRRRNLIQQLTALIVKYVPYWVASCVLKKDYDEANRVYRLAEYLERYPLCSLTCIQMAHAWRDAHGWDYLPIEYVFEDGDHGWGQLQERVKEDYGKSPLFRPKIPRKTRLSGPIVPLTPLQVGDFIAYEVGKFYGTLDRESAQLFEQFRKSFLLIGEIPHKWGALGAEAIRTELNIRGVEKR
jgi:hypothetical protein